jgi:hypothetical protein
VRRRGVGGHAGYGRPGADGAGAGVCSLAAKVGGVSPGFPARPGLASLSRPQRAQRQPGGRLHIHTQRRAELDIITKQGCVSETVKISRVEERASRVQKGGTTRHIIQAEVLKHTVY